MPSKHIYFSDEIYLLIRSEENLSNLVSSLLKEHYEKQNLKELTKEELEKKLAIIQIEKEAELKKLALT